MVGSMRLALFYQIQVPKPWTAESEAQRIYEALEQIPFAEQQGFSAVWFSEHHFRPVWSHNSAPDLTLAAVSQRTERIRLGIGGRAGADPSSAAHRAAHGDTRHSEPRAGRCRTRPYRLSLSADPVRLRPARYARYVAGVRRRFAAHLDTGGDHLRRPVLQDSAPRSPAETIAEAAPAIVVGLRQRRDSGADRQSRNGWPFRQRRRPRPCPAADGDLPRR